MSCSVPRRLCCSPPIASTTTLIPRRWSRRSGSTSSIALAGRPGIGRTVAGVVRLQPHGRHAAAEDPDAHRTQAVGQRHRLPECSTATPGLDNCCSTLAGLGTNFGLWPLIGKRLAVIGDGTPSGRTDRTIVTERLLSISGEDALTMDRKNLPTAMMKLPTRILILDE